MPGSEHRAPCTRWRWRSLARRQLAAALFSHPPAAAMAASATKPGPLAAIPLPPACRQPALAWLAMHSLQRQRVWLALQRHCRQRQLVWLALQRRHCRRRRAWRRRRRPVPQLGQHQVWSPAPGPPTWTIPAPPRVRRKYAPEYRAPVPAMAAAPFPLAWLSNWWFRVLAHPVLPAALRSEERRVGKECPV